MLIILHQGKTRAYSRKGLLVEVFSSALPGGNSDANMHHSAIVDCIWVKERQLYYILDVLYWHNLPFTYCEVCVANVFWKFMSNIFFY